MQMLIVCSSKEISNSSKAYSSRGVGRCYVQRILSNVIFRSISPETNQATFTIVKVSCGNTNEGTSHHMITIPVTRKLYMFSLLHTNIKC